MYVYINLLVTLRLSFHFICFLSQILSDWLTEAVSVWFLRFYHPFSTLLSCFFRYLLFFLGQSTTGVIHKDSTLFGASLRDCHRSWNFHGPAPSSPTSFFLFLFRFASQIFIWFFHFPFHLTWNVELDVVCSRLWGCCFFPDLLNHFSLAEGADRCDIGHRFFFFLFDLLFLILRMRSTV